jgi:hypothetical protein
MIRLITNYWDKHGFEILFISSVIFIIVYAIIRIGHKGTYSDTFFYLDSTLKIEKPRKPTDSKGEIICRNYLEKVFQKKFTKARPNFLRNPVTNNSFNLELDCYNEDLKLALEYNGVQHYKYVPYFHKNKEAFLNQKYRDEMKRTKCKENGIRLIEIPYTVKHEDLENNIRNELLSLGFKFN